MLASQHSSFSPRSAPAEGDDVRALLQRPGRVIVVAPHPDDEVLGIGGSLAVLERSGREVLVVAVTDGSASHPGSSLWSEERLRWTRPLESIEALARLHSTAQLLRLEIEDGRVERYETALMHVLDPLLDDAAAVFCTWSLDGHPDHEACGRAAREAARNAGVPCFEYVVWGLVDDHPARRTLEGRAVRRLALDDECWQQKMNAISAFESQIHPDPSTGADAVLSPSALMSWRQHYEVVLA
jgi:LmbE family N-acetylglucosaminyl deacetylase